VAAPSKSSAQRALSLVDTTRAVVLRNEDGVHFTSSAFADCDLLSSPKSGFAGPFGAAFGCGITEYLREKRRDDARRKDTPEEAGRVMIVSLDKDRSTNYS